MAEDILSGEALNLGGVRRGADTPAAMENVKDQPSQNFSTLQTDVFSSGVYSYQSTNLTINGSSATVYAQFIRSEVIENARHIQPGAALDDTNNAVWSWGTFAGDNTGVTRSSPVSVVGGHLFDTVIKRIDTADGDEKVMAMNTSGFAWTWGDNANGELGNQSAVASASSPVSVVGGQIFVTGDVGLTFKTAIDYLGYCYAWGTNTSGQLGGNTVTNSSSPISVVGAKLFVQVAAGGSCASALDTSNYAWSWGSNTNGQVGDNTTTDRSSPVSVVGNMTFYQLRSGTSHRLGLGLNGRLFSWGNNTNGQLGNLATANTSSPVSVNGIRRFVDIACGDTHNLALDKFGVVWAWGNNAAGQLGDGTVTLRSSPTSVNAGITRFVLVGASGDSSAAIDTLGYAWAWGSNTNGVLGDRSTTSRSSPVLVTGNRFFKTRKVY